MTAQAQKKLLLGIGALIILILILIATGILKFQGEISYTPNRQNQSPPIDYNSPDLPPPTPEPLPDLIFFSDQGSPQFTIQPPRGWQEQGSISNSTLSLKAIKPDIINSQEVRPNLIINVTPKPTQAPLEVFRQQTISQIRQQLPTVTISEERLTQINSLDAFRFNMQMPGPNNVTIKQVQYIIFTNDFIITALGTGAQETWDKHETAITSAIESISLANPLPTTIPEL